MFEQTFKNNDDGLAGFVKLQGRFADSEKSWTVKIGDIDTETFDLSVRSPSALEAAPLRSLEAVSKEMEEIDSDIRKLMEDIREIVN